MAIDTLDEGKRRSLEHWIALLQAGNGRPRCLMLAHCSRSSRSVCRGLRASR